MIKIRSSTFETNSSSSHSLVYSRKNPDRFEPKLETEDGVLTIHFNTYSWTGPEIGCGLGTKDILASSNDKLDYVMSYLCHWMNYRPVEDEVYMYSFEDCEERLKNGILEEDDDVRSLLVRIQDLCPEVKDIRFELNPDSYYPFGYIDHDSTDLLFGSDPIDIIFNKGILILITNDNSDYYEIFNEELKPGLNEDIRTLFHDGTIRKYNITEGDFEE